MTLANSHDVVGWRRGLVTFSDATLAAGIAASLAATAASVTTGIAASLAANAASFAASPIAAAVVIASSANLLTSSVKSGASVVDAAAGSVHAPVRVLWPAPVVVVAVVVVGC